MAKNEIFCFTRIHGLVQCREPVANVFVPAASCTMQLTKSCILGLVQCREPVANVFVPAVRCTMQLTQSCILGSVQFRGPVPAASCTMQLTQSCILTENVKEGEGQRGGGSERIAPKFCFFVYSVFLITPLLCLPIIKQTST